MFRYFKNIIFSDKKKIQLSPEEELTRRLKPYERHLYKMQNVIAWKDLHLSIFFIIIVNLIFWLVFILLINNLNK